MNGVYIIKFDIYPDIYKIGKSKDIDSRYKQFKQNTSILGDVKLIYSKEFEDYSKAEYDIHLVLKDYRVQENREFFKGDVHEFIKVIENMNQEDYKIIKNSTELTEIKEESSKKQDIYNLGFKEIDNILPDFINIRIPNYTKYIIRLLENINQINDNTKDLQEIITGLIKIVSELVRENKFLYKSIEYYGEEIDKLKQEIQNKT